MCVSLRVLLLSPSITGADAEVVCAESKEQLTTFRALVRAFRVSCTQCDSSVQVQCHMTSHDVSHEMSHDSGVAGRHSTEGEAGHGYSGGGQSGAVQDQLQPKICQDQDEAFVSSDNYLLPLLVYMYVYDFVCVGCLSFRPNFP